MKTIMISIALLFTSAAFANDHCDNQCQRSLITDYYQKLHQILMAGSTEKDVDIFLDILHDEVRYLHTEYQADFNKETWRNAFLRHLKAGRYSNSEQAVTTVKRVIHGYQTAAVEFISRYNDDDSGELVASPMRLAIFKFKDSKIVSIQDHWYHVAEDGQ